MAWNVGENEAIFEEILSSLIWEFTPEQLQDAVKLTEYLQGYLHFGPKGKFCFVFFNENLDLGKYSVIKLSCYLLFAVMLNGYQS